MRERLRLCLVAVATIRVRNYCHCHSCSDNVSWSWPSAGDCCILDTECVASHGTWEWVLRVCAGAAE